MDSPLTQRIDRVTQVVADVAGDLRGKRVLDLGCYDGAFALAVARRGASVVGIEGRQENLAPGIEARDAEGLDVEFVCDDVRSLSHERHGEFDIVLCLGILYHLPVPDVFEFARELARVSRGPALIETQFALSRKTDVEFDGRSYAGLLYAEDVRHPGASLDNPKSFWPTKPSLLNLLRDVGFTSVSEVLSPAVPSLIPYQDHTLLLAYKGEPERSVPWPERWPRIAHPAQGRRYVLRDRLARLRGGGLPEMFRDRGG